MKAQVKSELQEEFRTQAKKVGFATQPNNQSSLSDYLLHHKSETWALQVLVKGRWWAQKGLLGNNIWIAFPDGGKTSPRNWYVVPHGLIVQHGKKKHSHTLSWKQGLYHRPSLSKELVATYDRYKIEELVKLGPEHIKLLLLQNAKDWD